MVWLRITERSAGPVIRIDGGTAERGLEHSNFLKTSFYFWAINFTVFFFTFLGEDKYHQEKLQTCFLLPWTTTLKSLWWFPASLVATHWKCAVSESWARETTSRRPLAAIRKPCPCLSGFPFLNHLSRGRFPNDSVSACMSGSALCMSEWHLTWWQVQVFLWLDTPAPWGC